LSAKYYKLNAHYLYQGLGFAGEACNFINYLNNSAIILLVHVITPLNFVNYALFMYLYTDAICKLKN